MPGGVEATALAQRLAEEHQGAGLAEVVARLPVDGEGMSCLVGGHLGLAEALATRVRNAQRIAGGG